MKTVLITTPVSRKARYTTGLHKISNIKPPLGLAYLAASLELHGKNVDIIDADAFQMDADVVLDKIDEAEADIVGMTCLTMSYSACRRMAQSIKKRRPCCLIVFGGPHASLFPGEILEEETAIDVVAFGEGEKTIIELVEAQENGHGFEKIHGIAFRQDGVVHINPPREVEKDLDSYPYPAWDKLPIDRYNLSPQWEKRAPVLTMIASRGCPFHCAFCSKAVFGDLVRYRSPRAVIEEMKFFKEKLSVKDIAFADDTFTLNKKWVSEFCELVIREKVGLTWSCMSRVDMVTSDILRQMSLAGCWNIFFGIESGNQEILDSLCKGIKLDEARLAVRWAKEAGLEVQTSFMLALPGETPEIAMETIRFAIELNPDYAKFNITAPFKGTVLFEQAKKAGRVFDDPDKYTTQHPVFIPYGYKDQKEILKMKRKAFRKFYLRPRYIIGRILKIRSLDDIKRYLKAAKGYYAIIKG